MAGKGEQQRGGVMGEGRGKREREEGVGEIERVMVEEARGHSQLQRRGKRKMSEREKSGGKMWSS